MAAGMLELRAAGTRLPPKELTWRPVLSTLNNALTKKRLRAGRRFFPTDSPPSGKEIRPTTINR
jgi:hypothetical protein